MAGAQQAGQLVRVVVVDDHAGFREALVDALRCEHGIVVCGEAATVETALAAIALHKPDVAMVDLSLGRESGLDLVSALTRTHPAVRVLVLTGYDEPDRAERILKAGALGCVTKAKVGRELLTAVRCVAAGKPYTGLQAGRSVWGNPVGRRSGHSSGGEGATWQNASDVKLRNAHLAIIDRSTVLDYLLNQAHPDNGRKARFFASLGYSREDPERLMKALWPFEMIKEHDRIVLTEPVPAEGLEVGDVGTVVHVYADGKAFEVEFTTLDGKTATVATVEAAAARPVTGHERSRILAS